MGTMAHKYEMELPKFDYGNERAKNMECERKL
jgi:hypothetical protein